MRFLLRLGVESDWIEIDELAVKLGLLLRPERLHCQDAFSQELETAFIADAVILHLFDVPAAADGENEPAAGKLVEARDRLGGDDRIALGQQCDAGTQLERAGRRRRKRQCHERIGYANSAWAVRRRPETACAGLRECVCARTPIAIRSRVPRARARARRWRCRNPSENKRRRRAWRPTKIFGAPHPRRRTYNTGPRPTSCSSGLPSPAAMRRQAASAGGEPKTSPLSLQLGAPEGVRLPQLVARSIRTTMTG